MPVNARFKQPMRESLMRRLGWIAVLCAAGATIVNGVPPARADESPVVVNMDTVR